MAALVWIGAAMMLAGVILLGLCIATVRRVQRADMAEGERTRRMHQVVIWNYAALALAGLGAMVLVVGGLLS